MDLFIRMLNVIGFLLLDDIKFWLNSVCIGSGFLLLAHICQCRFLVELLIPLLRVRL